MDNDNNQENQSLSVNTTDSQQAYTPQNNVYPQQPVVYFMPKITQPYHGFAVASLVLGIISAILILYTWMFAFVSGIPGVVGFILAAVAKKNGNREGINTAGLILCIIPTFLFALFMLYFVSCVGCGAFTACTGADSDVMSEWQNMMQNAMQNHGVIFFRLFDR